ncbi:hypothetical protein [Pseudomonas antarctica]|uniref:hypothetical protein n=1 Tax=Pseudomonas antarctica TaxID=219572 RepID=UPI003F74D8FD
MVKAFNLADWFGQSLIALPPRHPVSLQGIEMIIEVRSLIANDLKDPFGFGETDLPPALEPVEYVLT